MRAKTVETSDFDAFARRILRAYGRRVADGDLDGLTSLAGLERELRATMAAAVKGLRAEPWRYSWTEIGRALGVERQSAWERFSGDSES